MKKIILFLIGCSFIMFSCQGDLLDRSPYDQVSSGNMWRTEELADKGVLGVYASLNQEEIGRNISTVEAIGPTGNMIWNYGFNRLLTANTSASEGYFSNYWKQHYELISNANVAIANLPIAPISNEKLSRLISECKFLRSYAYYRLNSVYKGVPLYLEPTEVDDLVKGRETEEGIWNAVIDDLTDCINDPNLPLKYEKNNDDFGRVTKGAAYALRGKVYLWLKKYGEAEKDFVEVGKCGYDLYRGEYIDMFNGNEEQSDEVIFSLQAVAEPGYGNSLTKFYGNKNTYGSCIDEIVPSTDFCETYQWKDGSPFNWDDVIPGYNSLPLVNRKVYFLRDNLTDEELTKAGISDADKSKYLPNGNEARILKAYTDRDPRLTASVITPYSEYVGSDNTKENIYTLRFPYKTDGPAFRDIQTNSSSNFYYLFRKFVGVGHEPYKKREDSNIDVPLIRYADVLLNLAEALNEQNKVSDAVTVVNKVRDRAGVALLNSSPETTVKDMDDLRERIKFERRWELIGEAISFFDEMRWGAESYKKSRFFEKSGYIEASGCKEIWGVITRFTTKWDERVMKWPIPVFETQMNPNIIQNTGWES